MHLFTVDISRAVDRFFLCVAVLFGWVLMTGSVIAGQGVPAEPIARAMGNADVALEPANGNRVLTRSNIGSWILRSEASQPGLNCAVRFVPGRKNAPQLAIFGPTPSARSGMILFSGPDIPWSMNEESVQLDLSLRGLPPTTLKARQLPRQANFVGGMLAVGVGYLVQTLNSMRDQERLMELSIRGSVVFGLDYDEFAQARAAMLDCLAGRTPVVGKSLDKALAEIRPVGNSTIRGQVFYKGAVLASKQYPKKGSQAVSLVWLTDEVKRWQEQVKQDKKLPAQIPESIAKHFMRTVIADDKGSFTFSRLPAGEFMLIANFSFEKIVTRSELVGQTHTFAGNQHIGTQDHRAYWQESVLEPTTFERRVEIKTDGDTLDVSLDKSLMFCFLVCF